MPKQRRKHLVRWGVRNWAHYRENDPVSACFAEGIIVCKWSRDLEVGVCGKELSEQGKDFSTQELDLLFYFAFGVSMRQIEETIDFKSNWSFRLRNRL